MLTQSLCVTQLLLFVSTDSFQLAPNRQYPTKLLARQRRLLPLYSSLEETDDGNSSIQWALLQKHHVGSWKGIWTTYDSMGDVVLESIASVDIKEQEEEQVQVSYSIVQGATRSDCNTCFDSMELKTIPVATYSPDNLATKRVKLGANGMVIGPSVLRSGVMATELVLSQSDNRIRVIFQHAPVWGKATTSQTGPPDGLKLFRILISRESQSESPPNPSESSLFRPIPPFMWHKEWAGTSWTWGPDAGDRGWGVASLEDGDTWHGSAPPEVWNLRLPGGIFVQSPRVLHQGEVGLCRLAWLWPDEKLLRLEAGVQVLEPLYLGSDEVVGFAPPSLATYRCDILDQVGDLKDAPSFVEDSARNAANSSSGDTTPTTSAMPVEVKPPKPVDDDDDSGLQAIRDALQL